MNEIPLNAKKSIEKVIDGVKEILGERVKKIILYGSYARGDYNDSSDIDIMILTDLNEDEISKYKEKIWAFTYDIELDNNVLISPTIRNIDTYNIRITYHPFYKNVQKEGVVLVG